MTRGEKIACSGVAVALVAGAGYFGWKAHEEDVLELRSPYDTETQDFQSPIEIDWERLHEVMKPIPEEQQFAALPAAPQGDVEAMANHLSVKEELTCPDPNISDEVHVLGSDETETFLCVDTKNISAKTIAGISWLVVPAAIQAKEGHLEVDLVKTYEAATTQQCQAAVNAVNAIGRRLVKAINPAAYDSVNFKIQAVISPTAASKCDQAQPIPVQAPHRE